MPSSCKQTLEITVPVSEVAEETERVIRSMAERVRLPGFRPGKAPLNIVRTRFSADIREEVIRALVPKHFRKRADERELHVVGTPDVTDVHFHDGEPLTFKAEFEVIPEIELGDYGALEVAYQDPEPTEEEVAQRLDQLREQKAEFVNEAPRPVADGDHAVVSLEAQGQVDEALRKQEEVVVHIGGSDTLEAFSVNLLGMTPDQEKEFEVAYPADYGDAKLSGRTVRFKALLKGIRRKELPELSDAFAADLGDFKTLEELRDELRKAIHREKEYLAQQEAKSKLVEQLVQMHDFPVPESLVEGQIKRQVEQLLRSMAARGADLDSMKLDWAKIRESQQERAAREVKASLLVDRIAEREKIGVTTDEVDHEVQRIARHGREPVATVRKRLEEADGLRSIASRIRSEKTLSFLFEHARKIA